LFLREFPFVGGSINERRRNKHGGTEGTEEEERGIRSQNAKGKR
jgi:hypothetical protein